MEKKKNVKFFNKMPVKVPSVLINHKVACAVKRLYPEDTAGINLEKFYKKKLRSIIIGVFILMVFSGIILICELWTEAHWKGILPRNEPGRGELLYHLQVNDGSWLKDTSVDIRVPERTYSSSEYQAIFKSSEKWVDEHWLGNNKTAEQVTTDLNFAAETGDYGVAVEWMPDNARWIHSDGKVTEEGIKEAPVSTQVYITMHLQNETYSYKRSVTIQKPVMLPREAAEEAIVDAAQTVAAKLPEVGNVTLPSTVDGKTILWKRKREYTGIKILIFGLLCLGAIYLYQDERLINQSRLRDKQLQKDYPEIVYQLVLLIGAGLTIRRAWERISINHSKNSGSPKILREGYGQMEKTLKEMSCGITEKQAYVNFGRRCTLPNYMRLSSLLVQQLQKGAKGMNQMLINEAAEAEILRRENARKLGEEASVKLIFPMILLMGIVFAILIFPAIVSFHI